jgi:processive 1,2-diacylglycerol beta-glucosyltransferase
MLVRMIRLTDKETGTLLGTVTDEQFKFLVDLLEEESAEDTDYFIDESTLEWMEEEGADKALVEVLRKGLGGREEMEVRWVRV